MTPAARIAAAIDILDEILGGEAAEKVLTTWARRNRYAGSKDRAAIRDHVFDALRCRRSFAELGGTETGRGLMLGQLRAAERNPAEIFTGMRHAPAPLSGAERAWQPKLWALPTTVACDCPEWLAPRLQASLGADFEPVMMALRQRAPVFLRVNAQRLRRPAAMLMLAEEKIETAPHALSETALEVLTNARRVQQSRPYAEGLVELQDAASQAVADMMPVRPGMKVLDYCAGGGGKTLAMAGRENARFYAHDAAPRRMRDLPERAERAGVIVTVLEAERVEQVSPFDLVLCDVPCSGSGAWRRSPEAKWRLTADDLERLTETQAAILDTAAGLVAKGGTLAYATCSLLEEENGAQVRAFLDRRPGWRLARERRLTPLDGGDGFYAALLERV